MEHFLIVMFARHLKSALKKQPDLSWLIWFPIGPLLLWLSARAIIFEAFGELGLRFGYAWLAAGAIGIGLTYASIVHLIAWAWHFAVLSRARDNCQSSNPDAPSESN
ncbi:MAG: hypothetical protein HY290_30340 [Planctomycetia bacterium]|nr:hypothetical protein [Planctomycetia bacterium]